MVQSTCVAVLGRSITTDYQKVGRVHVRVCSLVLSLSLQSLSLIALDQMVAKVETKACALGNLYSRMDVCSILIPERPLMSDFLHFVVTGLYAKLKRGLRCTCML